MTSAFDPTAVVNQLPISLEIPREGAELQEILSLMLKRYAQVINTKEGGLYTLIEQTNFKQYYPLTTSSQDSSSMILRNVFRKVFDIVALNGGPVAGGATVSVAHGIIGIVETAEIYASCTSSLPAVDPGFFSVMYPNARLTTTNVIFTNPIATPLNRVTLVADYLKN